MTHCEIRRARADGLVLWWFLSRTRGFNRLTESKKETKKKKGVAEVKMEDGGEEKTQASRAICGWPKHSATPFFVAVCELSTSSAFPGSLHLLCLLSVVLVQHGSDL